MGFVHTQIRLKNPRNADTREIEVRALVDTGGNHLCLPNSIVVELGLEANTTRSVKTADGTIHQCRYVGPVRVQFENRECFVGALELGDAVLLGAIPMEDPDFPDSPHALVVGLHPDRSSADL